MLPQIDHISFKKRSGFSLIEIVFSISIFSFCVLSLFGLLISGINSMVVSRENLSSIHLLGEISNSILHAQSIDGLNYTASGNFSNLTWNIGGETLYFNSPNFNPESGSVRNTSDIKAVALYVQIDPPSNSYTLGNALVSIAWPANSNAKFDVETCKWEGTQGSESTRIMFLPSYSRVPHE